MKKQKQTPYTSYLIIVLFILQIVSFAWLTCLQFKVQSDAKVNAQSLQDNAANVRKLQFCHDNAITPCDGIAITQWNSAHPDNTFTF